VAKPHEVAEFVQQEHAETARPEPRFQHGAGVGIEDDGARYVNTMAGERVDAGSRASPPEFMRLERTRERHSEPIGLRWGRPRDHHRLGMPAGVCAVVGGGDDRGRGIVDEPEPGRASEQLERRGEVPRGVRWRLRQVRLEMDGRTRVPAGRCAAPVGAKEAVARPGGCGRRVVDAVRRCGGVVAGDDHDGDHQGAHGDDPHPWARPQPRCPSAATRRRW
jgi:hypothetical protein